MTGTLTVDLQNIHSTKGIIWVGIYNSEENFMIKENAIVEGIKINNTGNLKYEFPNLEYGTYAIALFHDENYNGEMDFNVLGIPSEPFGFSGKPKSRWRMPTFHELKFEFKSPNLSLPIKLMNWSPF